MRRRSLIAFALGFALLAGQMFVPATRAACGMSRGSAAPACSGCIAPRDTGNLTWINAGMPCCAAPRGPAERAPATVQSGRGLENRSNPVVALPIPQHVADGARFGIPGTYEAPPPLSDSPHRRTTVLLI